MSSQGLEQLKDEEIMVLADKEKRLLSYLIVNKHKQQVPFIANRAQSHFAKNKHTRNLILKSRRLGFTTDGCIRMLDDALWNSNFQGLFIAQDLDTAKDLFSNKIELAWKNYPLQALYKTDTQSARQLKFDYGDGTQSSITVDSSGRSGTYNKVHITEFADVAKNYPDKATEIIEGTIPSVPMDGEVTIESTAQGAGGLFYDMFMMAWNRSESPRPMEYKAHFYNWQWDDEDLLATIPESVPDEFKTYQTKYSLSDVEITYYYHRWLSLNKSWNALKREYPTTPEEAFEAIIEGVIYSDEITQAKQELRIKLIPHNPLLPVFTVWDLGKGANMAIGFFQRPNANEIRMIDYMEGKENEGLPQIIPQVLNRGYVYGDHFAPHDIRAVDIGTGKTRIDTAKILGILFKVVPTEIGSGDQPRVGVIDGIDRARIMWPKLWINEIKCKIWLDRISSYRREWDDIRGMWKDKPQHNNSSHCFSGETMILTRYATYPIMDLPPNGEVLTPIGWKRYYNPRVSLRNAELVEVLFKDGMKVKCTPDHLFLTDKGWKFARSLKRGSKILSSLTCSPSTLMEYYTGSPRVKTILAGVVNIFIGKYGNLPLGRYHQSVISTIKIAIQRTTISGIWNVWMRILTYLSHGKNRMRLGVCGNLNLDLCEIKPQSGIVQKQEYYGTKEWPNAPSHGQNGKEKKKPVSTAERNLWDYLEVEKDTSKSTVMQTAKQLTIESVNYIPQREDVWDITVPGIECFSLENGAIVHNSGDVLRYAALVEDQMINKKTQTYKEKEFNSPYRFT